jgi:hypothetical protein
VRVRTYPVGDAAGGGTGAVVVGCGLGSLRCCVSVVAPPCAGSDCWALVDESGAGFSVPPCGCGRR